MVYYGIECFLVGIVFGKVENFELCGSVVSVRWVVFIGCCVFVCFLLFFGFLFLLEVVGLFRCVFWIKLFFGRRFVILCGWSFRDGKRFIRFLKVFKLFIKYFVYLVCWRLCFFAISLIKLLFFIFIVVFWVGFWWNIWFAFISYVFLNKTKLSKSVLIFRILFNVTKCL